MVVSGCRLKTVTVFSSLFDLVMFDSVFIQVGCFSIFQTILGCNQALCMYVENFCCDKKITGNPNTQNGCIRVQELLQESYYRRVYFRVRNGTIIVQKNSFVCCARGRVQTYTWTLPLSSGSQPKFQCDAGALSSLSAKSVNNQ
jgi:hypothetical protein